MGGFESQNDPRVHFGLGAYAGPVDIEVTWPRGNKSGATVGADARVTLRESAPAASYAPTSPKAVDAPAALPSSVDAPAALPRSVDAPAALPSSVDAPAALPSSVDAPAALPSPVDATAAPAPAPLEHAPNPPVTS
jgi:hypothetical protein